VVNNGQTVDASKTAGGLDELLWARLAIKPVYRFQSDMLQETNAKPETRA
jgi:hypothetical protein